MRDQTSDINEKFAELSKILKEKSEEIKQIKNSLNALMEQIKPKRMGAYLFPDCGYEWMFVQIKLPAETWIRIKAGEHVKVAGNGCDTHSPCACQAIRGRIDSYERYWLDMHSVAQQLYKKIRANISTAKNGGLHFASHL